jgi:hypothetical protein
MCANPLADDADSDVQEVDSLYTTVVFKNLRTRQGTVSLMECLICPECQTITHLGWLFCPQCGKKVDASFLQTMQPTDQAPTIVGTMDPDRGAPQDSLEDIVDQPHIEQAEDAADRGEQAPALLQEPLQQFLQLPSPAIPEQPTQHSTPQQGSADESKRAAAERLKATLPGIEELLTACSECGSQNASDYSFCLSCGAPLPVTKTVVMASIASPAKARLHLLQQGGESGSSYPIRNEVTIGRTEGSITFPRDSFMSSSHARIVKRGEDFVLIDEASSNGTFMRVKREVKLEPGDVILVGQQLFRFEA